MTHSQVPGPGTVDVLREPAFADHERDCVSSSNGDKTGPLSEVRREAGRWARAAPY